MPLEFIKTFCSLFDERWIMPVVVYDGFHQTVNKSYIGSEVYPEVNISLKCELYPARVNDNECGPLQLAAKYPVGNKRMSFRSI